MYQRRGLNFSRAVRSWICWENDRSVSPVDWRSNIRFTIVPWRSVEKGIEEGEGQIAWRRPPVLSVRAYGPNGARDFERVSVLCHWRSAMELLRFGVLTISSGDTTRRPVTMTKWCSAEDAHMRQRWILHTRNQGRPTETVVTVVFVGGAIDRRNGDGISLHLT